ncbi:SDR family NAD(P)-dependent oxidoreductase [Gemmobacter lanyuensis]
MTGGTAGIGLACVEAFAERGVAVGFLGRNPDRLVAAQRQLEDRWPGLTLGLGGDVTDPDARKALVAAVTDRFGTVDILVNNAGVAVRPTGLRMWRMPIWRGWLMSICRRPLRCAAP